MSYRNFIPEIWSEAINRDLERMHIFAKHTNRQYEGEVSQKGDSVRILGIGSPTVTEVEREAFNGLSAAETIEDTSTVLRIDRMSTFNYKIDDIDKRQAVKGIMEALSAETSEKLADKQDRFIANLSLDPLAVKDEKTAYQLTKDNILDKLMLVHQKLMENDVAFSTKVSVIVSPAVATLYKQARIGVDTDNSSMLENGQIGKFDGMDIYVSNNVCTNVSGGKTLQLIQVKTDRAIAFARPMTHTEAYRPDLEFTDAIKGFVLYGAKIVRPKEMFVMNCYL